ncbi:MAG: sialate O-acetylesterase [Mariniblastus sp.]|nr:sialate O-acetylesterase [Mariniblastus sp.]
MLTPFTPYRRKEQHLMNPNMPKLLYLFLFGVAVLFSPNAIQADEPLKVFILAGQSNMVGHARAHTIATLYASESVRDQELLKMAIEAKSGVSISTLEEQLARGQKLDQLTGGISNDKVKALTEGAEKKELEEKVNKLKGLHEAYKKRVGSACVESDRVYISSIADRNKKSGKLGIGYGASDDKIGPEFGFGLSMAKKIDGPILLIKTSWGGKSLNYNFRPPSVGEYQLSEKEKASDKADEINKNAGLNYRMMNESIRNVLADLKKFHPDYDANAGYEIAGFVWFQGYNDQFSPEFRDSYKANMMAFINDIRKEYKTPGMPFVIGVLGTGMTAEKVGENEVSLAQRAAAEAIGSQNGVASVESYKDYSLYSNEVFQKGWPKHYHEWDTVGSDRPYHYLGSGAFFVRLGDSFANKMHELMGEPKK